MLMLLFDSLTVHFSVGICIAFFLILTLVGIIQCCLIISFVSTGNFAFFLFLFIIRLVSIYVNLLYKDR